MESKHIMNRILAIVMCLIMAVSSIAVAEPVPADNAHQHEAETEAVAAEAVEDAIATENVDEVVEELGEMDLMPETEIMPEAEIVSEAETVPEMPEVFDKVEIFEPDVDLDVDINQCGRHMFDGDGVCAVCGYKCEHSLDEYDSNWLIIGYEEKDDTYHNVIYFNALWCEKCTNYIQVDDTEHVQEQTHANSYECDCGYINENYKEEEGDGENDCTHPELKTETFVDFDWDHEEPIVKYDAMTHTYRWIELVRTYCDKCGYEETKPTGRVGTETTAHAWDSNGTFCNLCPAECKHSDVVVQNTWDGGWEAEYVDENQHKYVYTLRANVRCKICNKCYGEDTDETIEFVEPHKFVDADCPHCEDCWYEPEGDVTIEDDGNGTTECTHANVVSQIIYVDNWEYEKKDEKGHTAKYSAYKTDVCADCGREMNEDNRVRVEAEDKTEYEPHNWWVNGDADWWKYGECECCGYITECEHKNAQHFEEQVGLNYTDITETTHSSVGVLLDSFFCPDCGLSDSSANGKTVVETDEPHYYINGVCPCGTACVHAPTTQKWDEVAFDENTHTITFYDVEYCPKCNVEFNRTVNTVTEDHVLVDGMCATCGFGELKIAAELTLGVGEKTTLGVQAYENAQITFTSSKPKVVSVGKTTGKLTVKKTGTSAITAPDAATGMTATCTVTVKKAPTSVKATVSKVTLGVGETFKVGAKLSKGSASNKITYSSGAKSVATVEADGTIKGVKAGTAKITVKAFNGKKGTCTVTVKAAPEVIAVTSALTTMSVGQTSKLTTKLTTKSGAAAGGSYSYSVSPADAATIKDGVLTAAKAGTVTVTAEAYNKVKGTVTIEVKPAPDKAQVEKTSVVLGVKETLTLKPTIANGSPATYTYKTNKKSVATVSKSGKITAKKKGTAVITVKPHAGEPVEVTVEVVSAPKSVKLSAKKLTMGVGELNSLKATLTKKTSSKLTWKSSKPNVVEVDQNGNLTAKGLGKATITVSTFNKKKATCTVTVKAAPTEVTMSADKAIMSVGQKTKLSVAFNKEAGGAYKLTAMPEGLVVFDGVYAKAVKEGTVKITATAFNGKSAEQTIEIKPAPDQIVVSATSIKMGVKEKITLKPTIKNGSPADLKFKSSKSSVASVSSKGVITAKKAGTAKITITPNKDASKALTITVKVASAASKVKMSAKRLSLVPGEAATLTAKVTGASNKLSWKSSDASVATVENGVVTAVGAGKATITVSTFNKKKATCVVTVSEPVQVPQG